MMSIDGQRSALSAAGSNILVALSTIRPDLMKKAASCSHIRLGRLSAVRKDSSVAVQSKIQSARALRRQHSSR